MNKSAVVDALRNVGLQAGDTVFVHSDLMVLGLMRQPDGSVGFAVPAELMFQAIQWIIGPNGTIVIPAFSYSWSEGKTYDPSKDPASTGLFSNFVLSQSGTRRSAHPILSLAANGPQAEGIIIGHDDSAFGAGSPYAALHRLNAKLLLVGVPFCSFKDYVEVACDVPYRYKKTFKGKKMDGDCAVQTTCTHHVRYLDPELEQMPFLEGLDSDERSVVQSAPLGASTIHGISAKAAYDILYDVFSTNPYRYFPYEPANRQRYDFLHAVIAATKDQLDIFNGADGEVWRWDLTETTLCRSIVDECDRVSIEAAGADACFLALDAARNEMTNVENQLPAFFRALLDASDFVQPNDIG